MRHYGAVDRPVSCVATCELPTAYCLLRLVHAEGGAMICAPRRYTDEILRVLVMLSSGLGSSTRKSALLTIGTINGVFARPVEGMPLMQPRPPAGTLQRGVAPDARHGFQQARSLRMSNGLDPINQGINVEFIWRLRLPCPTARPVCCDTQ